MIYKPQVILEKYLFLGHLLLTGISFVSLLCEETGFYSGKYLCSCVYLWSILDPIHSSSILSSPMLCGQDHTLITTCHWSMGNIQTVVDVHMSNFSKQAELGGKRLLDSKQFLDSRKLSSLWKRGASPHAILGPGTSLLISYFIWKEYFTLFIFILIDFVLFSVLQKTSLISCYIYFLIKVSTSVTAENTAVRRHQQHFFIRIYFIP